jgi:hypothetical protein
LFGFKNTKIKIPPPPPPSSSFGLSCDRPIASSEASFPEM